MQRDRATLNRVLRILHLDFHVCVVDGVFEAVACSTDADADLPSAPASVIFHPATGIDEAAVAQVQLTSSVSRARWWSHTSMG